ncbi:MAG: tetratricopeptide repeat protein [Parcubacteria group bacterium]
MFFYIPLGILLGALAVALYIVVRKFTYLKKLSPEILEKTESHEGLLNEFFPEITSRINKTTLKSKKIGLLSLSEKLLRRIRLLSSKIDGGIHDLAHSIRRSNKDETEQLDKQKKESEEVIVRVKEKPHIDLRAEEQNLILEIAKKPRDALLYEKLGDIYIKTKEFDDAMQSFKKALELDPENRGIEDKLDKILDTGENI